MIVRRLRRVKQIGNMHASPPASACLLAFEVEDEGPALRRDREQVPAGQPVAPPSDSAAMNSKNVMLFITICVSLVIGQIWELPLFSCVALAYVAHITACFHCVATTRRIFMAHFFRHISYCLDISLTVIAYILLNRESCRRQLARKLPPRPKTGAHIHAPWGTHTRTTRARARNPGRGAAHLVALASACLVL